MLKDQLKTARRKAMIDIETIAKELNIATSTYKGYEAGIREPRIDSVKKLAALYGITTDELLNHQPSRTQTTINRLKELGYSVSIDNDRVKVCKENSLPIFYDTMQDLINITEKATNQAIATQLPIILENVFLKHRHENHKKYISSSPMYSLDLKELLKEKYTSLSNKDIEKILALAAKQDKPKEKALPNPKE